MQQVEAFLWLIVLVLAAWWFVDELRKLARKVESGMTNWKRAEAVFAIEQGLRAIERCKVQTCIEHGQRKSRCAHQYHANGKVRHGCVKNAAARD